jgi:hypothetical protein
MPSKLESLESSLHGLLQLETPRLREMLEQNYAPKETLIGTICIHDFRHSDTAAQQLQSIYKKAEEVVRQSRFEIVYRQILDPLISPHGNIGEFWLIEWEKKDA